ncbi:Nuf2 family [Fusarium globosum]|uniref:Nuf2 family n=1 Tax=Fusarium globosum TaxID=78864 RepID=A0A8H5YEL7_9HYPO|nr:Nuf2 family [Fusarium globosum]
MYKSGVRVQEIADREGLTRHAIYGIIRRGRQQESAKDNRRSGRPRILSDQDKIHIKILVRNNPFISYQEIIDRARLRCSRRTIGRWLLDEGIQHKLALRRPFLSEEHAQLRKEFCDRYRHEDESFWYSWWFSDEVIIDRTDGDYTKWSFYRSGERLHKDKVQPRRRPLRHSQMFFGAINYDKPSRVVPLPSDPDSERGGVTGRRILSCLQSYLPDLIEEGETFQHDNARTFTCRKVQDWLRPWARRHGVSLANWPPYSPDLNPIENLWKVLKARICELYPEIAAYPKSTEAIERLIAAAEELWSEIEDDVVKNVIKSIPDRLNECYNANGYYTKY